MSLIKRITKAIVMAPVEVVRGVVEAANETMDVIAGTEKKDKEQPHD